MLENPVVGIDVSKKFSDICILSPSNEIIKRLKISNNSIGMESTLKILEELERDYKTKVVIIMEATAHYHQLLANFYRTRDYKVVVINPIQSGALKNINIRKVKSDKTDAYNIALLYRLKNYNETTTNSELVESIKGLCRQHKELTDEIVEHVNRLTGFLDISFPEFKKVFKDLQGKTALMILEKYSSTDIILNTDKNEIIESIKLSSHKSIIYAEKKYNELYDAALKSDKICISRASSNILIQTTVNVILSLKNALKVIDDEIKILSMENKVFKNNVELLKTIPGVGEYTACVILSELGDISKFSKPKELVAFFGLDPSVSQSGTFNRKNNRISKRGSSYVRSTLHMLAKSNVYHNRNKEYINPVMRAYFEKKIVDKPYKVVMCAVMRKMVQIIFAVLRNQKAFELRSPEEHQKLIRENHKLVA